MKNLLYVHLIIIVTLSTLILLMLSKKHMETNIKIITCSKNLAKFELSIDEKGGFDLKDLTKTRR